MNSKECAKRLKDGAYFSNSDEHIRYRQEVIEYVAKNGRLANAKLAEIAAGPYTLGVSDNNDMTSVCKKFEFTRALFKTGALTIS